MPKYVEGALVLPNPPKDLFIHIYGPFPNNLFSEDNIGKDGDALPYLTRQGVRFPEGGYAYLDRKKNILICCTTKDQLDLVDAIFGI